MTKFAKYKDELIKEQGNLIEAMKTMGQLTDLVPGDWEVHTDPNDNKELEPDALADKYEEETTNEGVLDTLEERLKEVTDALERIQDGTYGKCMNCAMSNKSTEIEPERLDANPTATTCLACSHIKV
jgi:RNA polymerase-binding transcription factor DksA